MIWLILLACKQSAITLSTDSGFDSGSDTAPTEDSEPDTRQDPLPLCVNEWMPKNETSAADETGATGDWIELHNPGLELIPLDGWTLEDDDSGPQALDGLSLAPGEFLLLWADERTAVGPTHLDFKLSGDGGTLSLYAPDGRGSVLGWGAVEDDYAIARVTDCCTEEDCLVFDWRGTPGGTNTPEVEPEEPEPVEVELLARGSTHRYWDKNRAPDDGWTTAGFDDSAWSEGVAPLGYGDAHIVTTINYGADDANKRAAAYFRVVFEAGALKSLQELYVDLLRDDGAAVYLNGVEVLRDNLPEGELSFTTLASSNASSETSYQRWPIEASSLVEGWNTLAIEVHQVSVDSSDLGFDVGVVALLPPPE
ncbi:lamin tail domain-containing protein [Myxococcota bacterium]|nr:lamin tail domain-containing protein [Myxococcota bacterium]